MYIYSFDGEQLKYMLVGGVNLLAENKAEIDALNVFPVPDGDTGTNMYLTMLSGVKEAKQVDNNRIGEVVAALSKGCLLGARGNSGVILSQIFRGFAEALKGLDRAGARDIARAFSSGAGAAYQAVGNPVEGTILTVSRKTADAFERAAARSNDPVRALLLASRAARHALDETPALLPVLKEAGVVDAGGKGFVVILEGIIQALKDAAAQRNIELFDLAATQQKEFAGTRAREFSAEIEFTYCTEFILMGRNIPHETLRQELTPYGDCLLVVGDDQIAKVHIHSNHPGLVLECALKYGSLNSVQVSNMEEQNQDFKKTGDKTTAAKPVGVLAVGTGEGIATILESMGVDVVVEGGQTMNPSTEDLLKAAEKVNAASIIILPNNKNILMSARQAAELIDKDAAVVPTVSIPQAFAAMLAYNQDDTMVDNKAKMEQALADVKTGEVTKAVRDTVINGMTIAAGDFIGLADDVMVVAGRNLTGVVNTLIQKMLDEDSSLASLYYGSDMTGVESREIANQLQADFPDIDFEVHYGGQPLYHFLISVE
ncbi:DAK2 domain-containing protein [Desulfotruncus alcoholivorax]|uniref:DAK2 domain-containing protein n=1 Tax=Desulfotruncus alcoholivorax TaxID=265477 RepID=UPI00041D8807|nr:DAK2 domain-containing protein [Desulfotruncus alcoholivorax]